MVQVDHTDYFLLTMAMLYFVAAIFFLAAGYNVMALYFLTMFTICLILSLTVALTPRPHNP